MIALRLVLLPVPLASIVGHEKLGGRNLQMLKAALPEHAQELRLMTGKEPAGPKRELITHISLSVGLAGHQNTFRRPTDEECDAAKSLFPLMTFEEIPSQDDPHVRHYWEVLT